MACKISNAQLEKLVKVLTSQLNDELNKGKTSSEVDILKSFDKWMKDKNIDPEKALIYNTFSPNILRIILATPTGEVRYDKIADNIDFNNLRKLSKEFKNSEEAVNKFFNPPSNTQSLDTQKKSVVESNANKPADRPTEYTEKQRQDLENLVDKVLTEAQFPYRADTPYKSTSQQMIKENKDAPWSDIINPTMDKTFNFLKLLQNNLAQVNGESSDVNINGHIGVKVKIMKLDNIDPSNRTEEDTSMDENLAKQFNASVITDNQGNILYFDNEYNVVDKTHPDANAIYQFMHRVKKEDGTVKFFMPQAKGRDTSDAYVIQSIDELVNKVAKARGIKQGNPQIVTIRKMLEERREAQMNAVFELQEKVNSGEEVLLDIQDVSRGLIKIELNVLTDPNTINWDQSDIKFKVQTLDDGMTYITGPVGNIPVRGKTLTDQDKNIFKEVLTNSNLKLQRQARARKLTPEGRLEILSSLSYAMTRALNIQETPQGVKLQIKGDKETIEYQTVIDYSKALEPEQIEKINSELDKLFNKTNKYNKFKYNIYQVPTHKDITLYKLNDQGVLTSELIQSEEAKTQVQKDRVNIQAIPSETVDGEYVFRFINGYIKFGKTIEQLDKEATEKTEKVSEEIKETKQVKVVRDRGDDLNALDGLYRTKDDKIDANSKQVKQAKQWWDNSPLSKHVEFEGILNVVNSKAWGEFKDSTITLYSGANYTVLYHEAWHAFSQHFLTKQEKINLYNEVSKTKEGRKAVKDYSKASNKNIEDLTQLEKYLAVEEFIAEHFRKYMMSNGSKTFKARPKTNNIFRRIIRFLKEVFKNITTKFNRSQGDRVLNKLYTKLRTGNIAEYTPNKNNSLFVNSALYNLKTPDGIDSNISKQDALLLVNSIDGIISDIIDNENNRNGNTVFTNALFNNPGTVLPVVYNLVKKDFTVRLQELKQKEDYESVVAANLIEKALEIFGDTKTPGGLVRYHMQKSPFMSFKTKELEAEDFIVTAEDRMNTNFDRSGKEMSLKEMTSNTIMYTIKSLKMRDNRGNIVLNKLGFAELVPQNVSWALLANNLPENSTSPSTMKQTLETLTEDNPWVLSLLDKLGEVSYPELDGQPKQGDKQNNEAYDNWTALWSTFNLARWNLLKVDLKNTVDKKNKVDKWDIFIDYSSTVSKAIERELTSEFRTVKEHEFIIPTENGNRLDLSVVDKYNTGMLRPSNDNYQNNAIRFLSDIGIFLTNNKDLLKELENIDLTYIYTKLSEAQKLEQNIYDIIDFLKSKQVITVPLNTGVTQTFVLPSEASTLIKLFDLENKYSNKYANIAQTTADNKQKYELGKKSTVSNQIDAINKANSFSELIALPHMSYLDPANNPEILGSSMMKTLFEFDGVSFGKRRHENFINVNDLTGTQVIRNNRSQFQYSVVTAKADKYTRLLQDIYSGLKTGRFSTTTHADKNTILSYFVDSKDKVPTLNNTGLENIKSKPKHLYLDPLAFMTDKGVDDLYESLIPYLDAEIKRINKVKAHNVDQNSTELENILGVTVEDAKNNLRGAEWGMFDTMLQKSTLDKILKLEGVENFTDEIDQLIKEDLKKHIEFNYNKTSNMLGSMFYLDPEYHKELEKQAQRKLTEEEAKNIIIKGYNSNILLKHADDINLFYGNISQFKHAKDDFHKRNAAVASTGDMFRTDVEAIDFINNYYGKPFSERAYSNGNYNFNTKLRTAVLNELVLDTKQEYYDEMRSSLIEEYSKRAKKRLGVKTLSDVELSTITDKVEDELGVYKGMEVGDAQGWISFDSYRILGKLSGKWSKKQEDLFQKLLNNPGEVTTSEIIQYFPPRKYQYYGPLESKGFNATAFHKYSLTPLIPSIIEGTKAEKLHDQMMKDNIDYAMFKTASKVSDVVRRGMKTNDQFVTKDGVTTDPDFSFTPNIIHLHYLKNQLDLNSEFKGKVIFSTQLRKLILEGLIENGVAADFKPELNTKKRIQAWNKLTNKQKEKASPKFYKAYTKYQKSLQIYADLEKAKIKKQIDFDEENPDSSDNISKIVNFIQKELKSRDLSEHEIEFIRAVDDVLVHDVSLSLNADQIERALNAIVNNRVIRQKVKGEGLVQLSNAFFDPIEATDKQKKQFGTLDLRFYRKEDGKVQGADVKIAMQGDFKKLGNLTHPDGKIAKVYSTDSKTGKKVINEPQTLQRVNEIISDETWRKDPENLKLITITGVRIPVQGMNSMEFYVVKEFLSEAQGNIIIPPAEIVAKSGSDFDIDKLTMMFPSIGIYGKEVKTLRDTTPNLTANERLERQDILKEQISDLRKRRRVLIDEKNQTLDDSVEFKSTITDLNKQVRSMTADLERLEKLDKLTDEQFERLQTLPASIEFYDQQLTDIKNDYEELLGTEEINEISDKLNKLTEELDSYSSEALQNEMLQGVIDILSLEESYVNLITPNSTELFTNKGGLVDQFAKRRDYKSTETPFGISKNTSPTRIFEPAYNIYKHESNSVGKDVLGLGAVDNTFSTIFNLVGAHMNPIIRKKVKGKTVDTDVRLLLPHNTMPVNQGEFKGKEAISLSHLYDVNNDNKISEVISQLMNGWVDVAKDAWIFDIQGNKKVSPVLLFLVQSGVHINEAVHFVSNPLVKEYAEETKRLQSSFAGANGIQADSFNFIKNKAKAKILSGINSKMVDGKGKIDNAYLNTYTNNTLAKLDSVSLKDGYDSFRQQAAFLHYLEIEKYAHAFTQLKLQLNYDTNKSTSFFEALQKQEGLEVLKTDNNFIPNHIIDKVLQESPIGNFNIADFQVQIWKNIMPFKTNTEINNYLKKYLSDKNNINKITENFGDVEYYANLFKNDLLVQFFVNNLKNFTTEDNSYKGYTLETTTDPKVKLQVTGDKILINKELLEQDYIDQVYTKTNIPSEAFSPLNGSGLDEYIRYEIEKRITLNNTSQEEFEKTSYFKTLSRVHENSFNKKDKESKEDYTKRFNKFIYFEYIREKALLDTHNLWKLFKADRSYADILTEANNTHKLPYDVAEELYINVVETDTTKVKNLNFKSLRPTVDELEVFHANILELQDSGISKVDTSTEQGVQENLRVSELYQMLPIVSFLQSGFDTSSFSINRAMPNEEIASIIESNMKGNLSNFDNIVQRFHTAFDRNNSISNVSLRKRIKNYKPILPDSSQTRFEEVIQPVEPVDTDTDTITTPDQVSEITEQEVNISKRAEELIDTYKDNLKQKANKSGKIFNFNTVKESLLNYAKKQGITKLEEYLKNC